MRVVYSNESYTGQEILNAVELDKTTDKTNELEILKHPLVYHK